MQIQRFCTDRSCAGCKNFLIRTAHTAQVYCKPRATPRLCIAALQFPIASSRFVAVSATIPNARDIAEWLSVDTARGLHIFGEDYRPVRLVTHVRGYNMTKVWQTLMHAQAFHFAEIRCL